MTGPSPPCTAQPIDQRQLTTNHRIATDQIAPAIQWKGLTGRRRAGAAARAGGSTPSASSGGGSETDTSAPYPWPRGGSRRPGRVLTALTFGLAASLLLLPAARAQEVEPFELEDGAFSLDFYRGPIISSGRVIGMGGAYSGLAEGVEGFFRTPAALANRPRHSQSRFDWDLSFSWLNVREGGLDYDNDRRSVPGDVDFAAFNFGGALRFGPWGFGFSVAPITYARTFSNGFDDHLEVRARENQLGLAHAFMNGELILGAGFTDRGVEIIETRGEAEVSVDFGIGAIDLGMLWRPPKYNWRIGISTRAANLALQKETDSELARAAPSAVAIPQQVAIGFSWLLWPKDTIYNPVLREVGPWKARAPLEDRRYVLLSVDLVAIGIGADDSVGLEGWVADEPLPAGRHETGSLHLGLESEILHNLLVARIGTYSDQDRSDPDVDPRFHFTSGADVRLFELWGLELKASGSFDVAPRYLNWSVGVGFWH